jgi:hypothetical protein
VRIESIALLAPKSWVSIPNNKLFKTPCSRSRCCDFLQADSGTQGKFGDIFIGGYKARSTNRFYTFGQVWEALMIIAFYTTAKGVK